MLDARHHFGIQGQDKAGIQRVLAARAQPDARGALYHAPVVRCRADAAPLAGSALQSCLAAVRALVGFRIAHVQQCTAGRRAMMGGFDSTWSCSDLYNVGGLMMKTTTTTTTRAAPPRRHRPRLTRERPHCGTCANTGRARHRGVCPLPRPPRHRQCRRTAQRAAAQGSGQVCQVQRRGGAC